MATLPEKIFIRELTEERAVDIADLWVQGLRSNGIEDFMYASLSACMVDYIGKDRLMWIAYEEPCDHPVGIVELVYKIGRAHV